MNNTKLSRMLLLVLLLLLSLTLFTACSKESPRSENIVTTVEIPSSDQAVVEHQKVYETLQKEYRKTKDSSEITELHIYYDNTKSMMGFAQAKDGDNPYTDMVRRMISTGKTMLNAEISDIKTFVLVDEKPGDGYHQELNWTEIQPEALQGQLQLSSFYTGSHKDGREGTLLHTMDDGTTQSCGPLTRLFLNDSTPFSLNSLTVIVTDLQEQGFQIETLANALEDFCQDNSTAAICIVGCKSPYTGTISVPVYSNSGLGTEMVDVQNYTGDAAFYSIIVGSKKHVEAYINEIKEATNRSTDYTYTLITTPNAVLGEPLQFFAVQNTMSGMIQGDLGGERTATETPSTKGTGVVDDKATGTRRSRSKGKSENVHEYATIPGKDIDKVYGSANIDLDISSSYLDGSNAFQYCLYPHNDSNGRSVGFAKVAQMSLHAEMPDGTQIIQSNNISEKMPDDCYIIYGEEIAIFEATVENEPSTSSRKMQWEEATKAIYDSVAVKAENINEALYEYSSGEVLVKEGHRVAYLRVSVDNSANVLSPNSVYRISIPIHTSMKADLHSGVDEFLKNYNADIGEYNAALQQMKNVSYRYDKVSVEIQEAIAQQFCTTPSIDVLLSRLVNLCTKQNTVSDVQYLDLLFIAQS